IDAARTSNHVSRITSHANLRTCLWLVPAAVIPYSAPMSTSDPLSRREFLAATAGFAIASDLVAAHAQDSSASQSEKLAIHGGQRSVKQSVKLPIRWGEPERERLNAVLGQDSLFYWKGPQTTVFT